MLLLDSVKIKLLPEIMDLSEEERVQFIPKPQKDGNAGIDLISVEKVLIPPDSQMKVKTSAIFELPVGTVGLVYVRSGMAAKHSLTLQNSVAVVDHSYTGTYYMLIRNEGKTGYEINPGDRIAQLVITPFYTVNKFEIVEEITQTNREEKGLGSSGV